MFVIGRYAKIKSLPELRGKLMHNTREMHVHNADPAKSHLNVLDGRTTAQALGHYRKRLGDQKVRKNAVFAVEYMLSASPEFFEKSTESQQNQYFDAVIKMVKDQYGAENVVSVAKHFDETTPHAHVIVIPINPKGKLSAKHYIGGGKADTRKFQTELGKIGADFGLKRGREGSTAKHTTIRQFYTLANAEQRQLVGWAIKGKNLKNQQDTSERLSQKTAKMQKEINAKIGVAVAEKGREKLRADALETELISVKTEAQKSEKTHLKALETVKNVVKKLENQLMAMKEKLKKANDNAVETWKTRNKTYLENIEKDRRALNKRLRHIGDDQKKLNEQLAGIDAQKADLSSQNERLEAKENELILSVANRLKAATQLDLGVINVPQEILQNSRFKAEFEVLKNETAELVAIKAAKTAEKQLEATGHGQQRKNTHTPKM